MKSLKPLPTEPDAFARLEQYNDFKDRVKTEIATLRERVAHFNLPYLSVRYPTSFFRRRLSFKTNRRVLVAWPLSTAIIREALGGGRHIANGALGRQYLSLCDSIALNDELMQGERKNYPDHLFIEEEVPNLRSVRVRRCSEKSTISRGLFWVLVMRKKILSSYKQTLIARMRCPAVH